MSKLWQKRAAELVEELQHSDLGQFALLVLMLDAVVLDDGLVATVALGFDTEGRKQVLGYRVGSRDNAEVAKDLLRGLMKMRWMRAGQQSTCSALWQILINPPRNPRSASPPPPGGHSLYMSFVFCALRRIGCLYSERVQRRIALYAWHVICMPGM